MLSMNRTFLSRDSNESSQTASQDFYEEPMELKIARLTFETFIFLVGVLGNLLVCFVTSRKRGYTSTGNLFILHLAIADLGILVVNFPFVVVRSEFQYPWPFGRFICRTIYPFCDIFFGVEIGCITAIAFHRYRMLVHCTKPQITLKTAKKIIFVIWFISFVFIVAPLIFVMELDTSSPVVDCMPKWPNRVSEQVFSIMLCFLFYIIPLGIILATYVKIRDVLKASTKRQNSYSLSRNASARSSAARSSQNRRAIQILTPVLIIFAISMLPFNAYRFFLAFGMNIMHSFKYSIIVFHVSLVLLLSNSSVNPIIYSVVNSEFRRDFYNYLKCNGDSCCSNTSENLTTVQKTTPEINELVRRNSAPLLQQDRNNYPTDRKRLSVDNGTTNRTMPSFDSAPPSSRTLLISINPTYESGGF